MTTVTHSVPGSGLRRRYRGGLELVCGLTIGGLFGLLIPLRDALRSAAPGRIDLYARFAPPGTPGHWLGTDHLGRDLWSRALEGLGWSLGCALAATLMALLIGATLGLAAAERAGLVRNLIRQTSSMVMAFPGLVVAICMMAVLGQGFWPLVMTLGLLTWPVFARVVYAEASGILARDYVTAARLIGTSGPAILRGHVLPAVAPTIFVIASFHFGEMLIAESALSFLGIGAPVGAATWGNMLADSRQYLFNAPWMLVVPGGAIVLAVLAANLTGDGLGMRLRIPVRRETL